MLQPQVLIDSRNIPVGTELSLPHTTLHRELLNMFNSFPYHQSPNAMSGTGQFEFQAVMGMLSLRNGSNDFTNANMGFNSSPQHQLHQPVPQRQNGNTATLPLTPPGSPGNDQRLVITDSSSKQSPDSSSQHYQPGQGHLDMNNRSAVQNLESQFMKHEMQSADVDSRRMVGTTAGLLEMPSTSDPTTMPPNGFNCYSSPYYQSDDGSIDSSGSLKSPQLGSSGSSRRGNRTEKKPIPAEMKDEKYFERRKKNNVAAKKSRDTRKRREDDIAMRCAMMEQQNTILRAQMTALREEAASLRHLLFQKRQRQAMQMQQNGNQQQQQQIANMNG